MSKLEKSGAEFRKKEIARNEFDGNDEYSVSHPNAMSDGDEKGKGMNNCQAGSLTDIKTRQKQIASNKYNSNREYNDSTA